MPHINRRIPDLGHEKKLPKEKPEDYKINPLQSLFRPPHLSNDPKVREGGIHTGHKYGPINLSWKGPNTKFWSGVPGYLMGLPSQEQIDKATALKGQRRLDASKISTIPSTFDQAFSKNAAKGNEFTYSLEEAEFLNKSGRKGEGVVDKPTAGDTVEAGSTAEKLEVKSIEAEFNKPTIVEEGENDGNQSVLTEWTTDQNVNEEATIVPGSEMAVSKEDNKQYQEDIVDKPSEPPKAEKKDGPFSTAADTVNTLNSMIKGLSTIMANMNPDAKSVAFADVDYFKNKMALDDWRKRMYGRQSRA